MGEEKKIKLKLSSLLVIIAVLIIILVVLVYVIWSQYNQITYLANSNELLRKKVSNIGIKNTDLADTIEDTESTNSIEMDNIEKTKDSDYSRIERRVKYSEMYNIPNKKVPDSKLDYTIAYKGYPIAEYPQFQIINELELNDANTKKYSQTYYTYDKQGLKKKVEGIFGKEQVYDGCSYISNLSKISVSKDFDLMPRDYEVIYDNGENLKKISDYLAKNSSFISEAEKIDLNGDGNCIYIVKSHYEAILEIDVEGNNKGNEIPIYVYDYDVFDKDQEHLATLYTVYDDFNTMNYGYSNIDLDVLYADIDNDSKMEIIIEIPEWEGIRKY